VSGPKSLQLILRPYQTRAQSREKYSSDGLEQSRRAETGLANFVTKDTWARAR